MDPGARDELERKGGVLCRQKEPAELYVADALGGWLRGSVGGAHRSSTGRGKRELVWHADMDRNRLQRFQARPVGLASQQNAGGEPRRTALAGNGRSPDLDSELGLPGRGGAASGPTWRVTARTAYRLPPTQAACGPAARTPIKLRGTRTPGVGGSFIHSSGLTVRQVAGRSLASDLHGSQKTAAACWPPSARAQTGAET